MPYHDLVSEHRIIGELLHSAAGRRILAATDPAAESGLESVARVRLRSAGLTVDSQVLLPNRQRIDLVVENRVAIELDGATHIPEAAFQRDRRKDALIASQGLVPLRFTYGQVMDDWERVHSAVERMLLRPAIPLVPGI